MAAASKPVPMRRGPKPKFDPTTRQARKREFSMRAQMRVREVAYWLAEHHPDLYEEAEAHANKIIEDHRGAIPGDPVPDTGRRARKG